MAVEYIYDPEIVDDVLKEYPCLHRRLKPFKEGKKSLGFPQARETHPMLFQTRS